VPDDTKDALRRAEEAESNPLAKRTLGILLRSAEVAEKSERLVCSDSGVPVYFVQLGTDARIEGDIKQAIKDGFRPSGGHHQPADPEARQQPPDQ
jgi:fumarate hydratase subunit alpha